MTHCEEGKNLYCIANIANILNIKYSKSYWLKLFFVVAYNFFFYIIPTIINIAQIFKSKKRLTPSQHLDPEGTHSLRGTRPTTGI